MLGQIAPALGEPLPPLFAPAKTEVYREMKLTEVFKYIVDSVSNPAETCIILRHSRVKENANSPQFPFQVFELLAICDKEGNETLSKTGEHFHKTLYVTYSGGRANYLERVFNKKVFALTGLIREEKINRDGLSYFDYQYRSLTVNPNQSRFFLDRYNERQVPGETELITFSSIPFTSPRLRTKKDLK